MYSTPPAGFGIVSGRRLRWLAIGCWGATLAAAPAGLFGIGLSGGAAAQEASPPLAAAPVSTGVAAAEAPPTVEALTSAGEPLAIPPELAKALRPGPPANVAQLRLLQDQVRRVVARSRPATVAVEMNDSVGSGVIVSADGLVLTAGHVSVEPNRQVYVRFPDGHRVKGRSLGVNHQLDSGLVKISDDPPTPEGPAAEGGEPAWPFVPISKESVHPGDWVVGLGQPNGFVEGRDPPVRLGRVLSVSDDTINTDATLVGGDSGGPLVNLAGEVVGIHSKIGEQLSSNYHVPVAAYQREWLRLMDGRMTGAPDGEDPADWRPLAGMALRQEGGELVVTQVFPRRPAAQAGVAVGDVLLKLAGKEFTSLAEIDQLIRQQEPFSRVPLLVRRGDLTVEIELWLGRASADFPGATLNEDGR